MTTTWHQQRGAERRLGLHRFIDRSCLTCGTTVDGSEEQGTDPNVVYPITCSPNDARLKDEFRDYDYEPHYWTYRTDTVGECLFCDATTDGSDRHPPTCTPR